MRTPPYRLKADLFKTIGHLGHPVRIRVRELPSLREHAAAEILLPEASIETAHLCPQPAVLVRARLVATRKERGTGCYRPIPEAADRLTVAPGILSRVLAGQAELLQYLLLPHRRPWPSLLALARRDGTPLPSLEPTMHSSSRPTVADAMLPPGLQVGDHTSTDRALDVLRGSRTDLALIRDDTGRCAGIVTVEQLSVPGAKPWYADNTRVRDIAHDHSPFARPAMPAAEVAADMRERSLAALPVVDDDGYAVGIVTAARLQTVLTTGPGDTTKQPDRDLGADAP